MLWHHYVYRRGSEVYSLWNSLFAERKIRVLYISGRGFDSRSVDVLASFRDHISSSRCDVEAAKLLLIGFSGYSLSDDLVARTEQNAQSLESAFAPMGEVVNLSMGSDDGHDEQVSANVALRRGMEAVLSHVQDYTDVILDVSSLPRIVYLTLLTGLLRHLVPDKSLPNALASSRINLQVLVADDAALDAKIRSEDPNSELVALPGFSAALQAESLQSWPLVWFPVLGENRVAQLQLVMGSVIPSLAEVCPILPHPARNPRRGDQLLVEYKGPLFDTREIPTTNVLYADEANPFETYRQMLRAMNRYQLSLNVIGGCRIVVTPLGSKLMTLGAGLACFEMRPTEMSDTLGVAIAYAEPRRYVVDGNAFAAASPEICSIVLTGESYGLPDGAKL